MKIISKKKDPEVYRSIDDLRKKQQSMADASAGQDAAESLLPKNSEVGGDSSMGSAGKGQHPAPAMKMPKKVVVHY